MGLRIIPVTPFEQNCSLIWCDSTREAVVVDPGGDVSRILNAISEEGVRVIRVLLTHGHLDHVGGARELATALNVSIVGPHVADQFWLDGLAQQSKMFGFPHTPNLVVDQTLSAGDVVVCGMRQLEVLHCPGHTPGHVVFFDRDARHAWVGDVLFAGSIGRTDFPQGDYQTLIRSIREVLFPLGDDVRFTPGHGPDSTFGDERQDNPFVSDHRYG